jgi:hypothetical protein
VTPPPVIVVAQDAAVEEAAQAEARHWQAVADEAATVRKKTSAPPSEAPKNKGKNGGKESQTTLAVDSCGGHKRLHRQQLQDREKHLEDAAARAADEAAQSAL